MKLFIASDIHGSARFCEELLNAWHREQAGRLILLGDLLYHGPRNDLPEAYEPRKVISMLNAHCRDILCVRGNCDTEVDQMVLQFPILADYALLMADDLCMYATHGHIYNRDHLPPVQPGDILLCGHTHVPAWDQRETHWILNPGSVSIPKGGSQRGYMTLEDGCFLWKTLDGNVWHELEVKESLTRDGTQRPGARGAGQAVSC